jgi:hypothetical protein
MIQGEKILALRRRGAEKEEKNDCPQKITARHSRKFFDSWIRSDEPSAPSFLIFMTPFF